MPSKILKNTIFKMGQKIRFAMVLAFVAVVAGCSLPVNEEPPPQLSPETKLGEQTQCLANVLPIMRGFMEGTASPEDVGGTWDCFGNALALFQKSTRGTNEDRFTAREMANFFERYFLKDVKISDRLLVEIFRLKQLFIGGNLDYLTRTEIVKLQQFSAELKGISLALLPFMKVYSQDWTLADTDGIISRSEFFEKANLQMQTSAKDLASIIQRNGVGYEISNFVVLLDELSQLYNEKWEWVAELSRLMPLVHKVKVTLAGGEETVVAPSEWKSFGLLTARGYVQYLRFYYFIKDKKIFGGGPILVYLARSIDDLFSYLGDMVSLKPGRQFTTVELKAVLDSLTDFYPSLKVSDALLREFMRVKMLIFGGSDVTFTPEDFEKARSKVDSFRSLTEKVLNFSSVYGQDWDLSNVDPEDAKAYFRDAELNLIDFGRVFGSKLETNYDLLRLYTFARELDGFGAVRSSGTTWAKLADQYVPTLIAMKNIILSQKDSVIRKDEWSDLLYFASRFYSRYLQYYYFMSNQDVLTGEGLKTFRSLTTDVHDILGEIIGRKQNDGTQGITAAELGDLLKALVKAGAFPEKINGENLQAYASVLVNRALVRPETRLAGKATGTINLESLDVIMAELEIFFRAQEVGDELYANTAVGGGLYPKEILDQLKNLPFSTTTKELVDMFRTPVSMALDAENRLDMSDRPVPYTRATYNTLNLIRAVVRLAIRSYAGERDRIVTYKGLTLEETDRLYLDLKPILVDLEMIDPRNLRFAQNRFRDASLFTPRADGDGFLSFLEGYDLAIMIISGLKIEEDLFKFVEASCPLAPAPFRDDRTVVLRCLLNVYSQNQDIFVNLPNFVSATQKMGQGYSAFALNLLYAAGYLPEGDGKKIKFGDFSLFPFIVQYVEMVFNKHDADRNGFINTAEAINAFPVFKDILRQASGQTSDKRLRGLFTWLLVKGKPPESLLEKISFLSWCGKDPNEWKVNASREKIGTILRVIAEATAAASK